MERQCSGLSKLGFAALTVNSALAIYRSWGDVGSVAFVPAADAALVLLFLCLRQFEEQARGRERDRIGAAGGQYSALARMGFAAAACNSALAAACNSARGDAASLAFVLLAYAALLALTWLFLRGFDGRRAHGAMR
ncbi:unnamed protein product [Urochloa decumbens]|uniref:Uncharacterized protein n=1 Tax=Urochloa decumbens TaxID=240449 RepID=A0ABC9DXP2_9POAL